LFIVSSLIWSSESVSKLSSVCVTSFIYSEAVIQHYTTFSSIKQLQFVYLEILSGKARDWISKMFYFKYSFRAIIF